MRACGSLVLLGGMGRLLSRFLTMQNSTHSAGGCTSICIVSSVGKRYRPRLVLPLQQFSDVVVVL